MWSIHSNLNALLLDHNKCHGNGSVDELAWDVGLVYPFLTGTGPLACLSLFPVADVDKVSND